MQDLTEVGYSAEKRRKIIILGISVSYEPDEELGKVARDLGTEEQPEANKIMRREKNTTRNGSRVRKYNGNPIGQKGKTAVWFQFIQNCPVHHNNKM